jgi:hypothetical protein
MEPKMISDDGDIVRGLGFMVIRAAHLEQEIDELLFQLSPLEPYAEKEQKYPISKKISKAERILSEYQNAFSLKILAELKDCKEHFEWRNELVHGRIYSPEYHVNNLKSGRPNVPDRQATSEELYMLANNLEVLTHRLQWPLSLPSFVSEALLKKA